jgi:hypothetical protein
MSDQEFAGEALAPEESSQKKAVFVKIVVKILKPILT